MTTHADQIFDLAKWLEDKTVESISFENYVALTRILTNAGWHYASQTKTWSNWENRDLPLMDAARAQAKAMKRGHLEEVLKGGDVH